MKTFTVVLLALGLLLVTGCKSPAPPLQGKSFSSLTVTGDEKDSSESVVRSSLAKAGAKFDVAEAPSLAVTTHYVPDYNGMPFAMTYGVTSTGVKAAGFSVPGGRVGRDPKELVASSLDDFAGTLSRKLPDR